MAASTVNERLRAAGIADPETVIAEATRAGLRLPVACALLEKESRGGLNLFGHDRDRNGAYIFPARDGDVRVTKELYLQYKRRRKATGLCQGVGPCQLTSAFLQDAADEAGGCWKPAINMRIGFGHMASLMKAHGESVGARMYNGSGPAAERYSVDLLAKARRWEAILAGAKVPSVRPRLVRRGDHGPLVAKITRRLAFVRSRASRAPYLDGARQRFDADVEAALKAFQREHGLDDDGVFGPLSARRLNRAVRAEKRRRQQRPATPVVRQARLPALVARLRRLDEETDDAWESLVAYSRRRRRLVAEAGQGRARQQSAVAKGLADMTAILRRIEGKLEEIVDIEEREEPAVAAKTAAVAEETRALAEEATAVAAASVPVVQAGEIAPAPPEGPAPPAPTANGGGPVTPPLRRLSDLSEAELLERVARLDKLLDKTRGELIGRYAKIEEEIARRRPTEPVVRRPRPKGKTTKTTIDPGGPHGGKVVVTKLGDRGLLVRRSKLALAGYLKAKGNPEHVKLRRALRREARRPRQAGLATGVWQEAVRAAQHIAGRPVTGELDGELVRVLQPYWPRDNAGKRILRQTPGWRAIPGQLTPNFNIKEFACKDAAHTGYVAGLVREQGLTKRQAKARAKELARRLERLRKLGGDRPIVVTSGFRTKAYNASLTGSATNSAHTRGYAADTPPPRGVSLLQHEQHALQAFECGVGYYPPGHGNFIHGDFDKTLGGRRRWGH